MERCRGILLFIGAFCSIMTPGSTEENNFAMSQFKSVSLELESEEFEDVCTFLRSLAGPHQDISKESRIDGRQARNHQRFKHWKDHP